jgi:hypothetical protein
MITVASSYPRSSRFDGLALLHGLCELYSFWTVNFNTVSICRLSEPKGY